VDFLAASVEFDVWAQPGYQISGLNFQEAGDSFLFGDGMTIVDGTLVAGSAMTSLSFPIGNVFTGPGGLDVETPNWSATGSINFGAEPVDHLHVVLENELLAVAPGLLDVADISKALAILDVTTIIPEPTSIFLLGAGLVGLIAMGEVRKRGNEKGSVSKR
jgi:hypothetical protein